MSALTFMYEGDGLIHTAPHTTRTAKPRPEAAATPPQAPIAGSPAMAERKGEALRSFFPKIGAWLADRVYFARMREVEAYLAQATDSADLEQRIRRLERAAVPPRY
jgi:hypothetical protein